MILLVNGKSRFIGKWRGFVTRTDDPLRQFRIKAQIPDVLGDVESNWALPCFEGGSDDPKLPKTGHMIWIEFEQGDPNMPIWTGSTPSSFQGDLPAPLESCGEDGETVLPPRGTAKTTTESGRVVSEPVVAFAGEYGNVRSFKTESGHHVEVDDTPGNERLAIIHKSSASIEMDNTGSLRQRLNRKDVTTTGDEIHRIMGKRIEITDGVVEEENRREVTRTTLGKLVETFGDDVEVVLNGSKADIACFGTINLQVDGRLDINTGGNLQQKVAGSLQQSVMGAHQMLITENAEEIIGNSLLKPLGKNIRLLAGNYQIETLLGSIILKTLPGFPVLIGDPFLATEPVILGNRFLALYNAMVNTFNFHTHSGSGSGPPNQQFSPLQLGVHTSTSVFVRP